MACFITALVCSAVLPLVVHAGALSSTVIPSETRRQGLAQENPCPEDTVLFTCTISSSTTIVRWRLDGVQLYSYGNPAEIGITDSRDGLTGSLVNATTTTLLADLSATLDAQVTNGTVIGCVEVGVSVSTTNETLTIIGVASAPTVSVRPGSLTSLTVDMTVPEYGRECVDMYRATAVVGGVTQRPVEVTVTEPNQMMYSFPFSELDLCRDNITSVSAVAVTNGVEGTMTTPVTDVPTDRSRIISTTISPSHTFTSSGVEVVLSWQVVDQGIQSSGFVVTCQLEGSILSCPANGNSVTQRMIIFPYSEELENKNVTFNVSYSYEMCENIPVTQTLKVVNVNSSYPVTVQSERTVSVDFNEGLFVVSSVDSVVFTSNCTDRKVVTYDRSPLLIYIPDTGINTGQCSYSIQLVDGSSQPIGYPITGYFIADGLAPVTEAPGENNNGASTLSCSNTCIGVLVGLSVIVIIIFSIVITFLLTYYVMKKRINQPQQSHQPQDQAMYEEMTNFKPGDDDFKMRENSAYGPVKH